MAVPPGVGLFDVVNKLINQRIDCTNMNDINGLNFLIQHHNDERIKQLALITLIKCGNRAGVAGKSVKKTKKRAKNRKHRKSKKNRKSRKSKTNKRNKK